MSKKIVSHFSETAGSKIRRIYDAEEKQFLGLVKKLEKGGYQIIRRDGKVREKRFLSDALKTVARAN